MLPIGREAVILAASVSYSFASSCLALRGENCSESSSSKSHLSVIVGLGFKVHLHLHRLRNLSKCRLQGPALELTISVCDWTSQKSLTIARMGSKPI